MKSYAVKTLTPAEADAVEVALWYDAQIPGLGLEFLEEVNLAAQRLVHHPEIHGVRFADVRRAQCSASNITDFIIWFVKPRSG